MRRINDSCIQIEYHNCFSHTLSSHIPGFRSTGFNIAGFCVLQTRQILRYNIYNKIPKKCFICVDRNTDVCDYRYIERETYGAKTYTILMIRFSQTSTRMPMASVLGVMSTSTPLLSVSRRFGSGSVKIWRPLKKRSLVVSKRLLLSSKLRSRR